MGSCGRALADGLTSEFCGMSECPRRVGFWMDIDDQQQPRLHIFKTASCFGGMGGVQEFLNCAPKASVQNSVTVVHKRVFKKFATVVQRRVFKNSASKREGIMLRPYLCSPLGVGDFRPSGELSIDSLSILD